MPIYEYRCASCGHDFERMQKMGEDPIRTCPKCGVDEVKKLISAAGFALQGGGWAKDNYGLKSSSSSSASSASSSSSSSEG